MTSGAWCKVRLDHAMNFSPIAAGKVMGFGQYLQLGCHILSSLIATGHLPPCVLAARLETGSYSSCEAYLPPYS